jgi:hypothetical protein
MSPLGAMRRPDVPSDDAFRRSGAALAMTALAGPFWNVVLVVLPGASLTVGRGLIVLIALLLLRAARRAPRPLPPVARTVWLLLGVLALLWAGVVAVGASSLASPSCWRLSPSPPSPGRSRRGCDRCSCSRSSAAPWWRRC